jgi:hypothetical protein
MNPRVHIPRDTSLGICPQGASRLQWGERTGRLTGFARRAGQASFRRRRGRAGGNIADSSVRPSGSTGCSVQMVLPASPSYRVPQRPASCATRNKPRPPSSVARARRSLGWVLLGSETSDTRAWSVRMSRSSAGLPA